jgi:hypothetical protein
MRLERTISQNKAVVKLQNKKLFHVVNKKSWEAIAANLFQKLFWVV